MPTLQDQIRAQWGRYGEWDAAGVDRVKELAQLLRARGINDISQMSLVKNARENVGYNTIGEGDGNSGYQEAIMANRNQVKFGNRTLGYLGDYNNDGTYGTHANNYLQEEDLIGWSAAGHGNVGYRVKTDPKTGETYIAPDWASSSDASTWRDYAKGTAYVAAMMAAGYGAAGAAGTGAGTGAAGAVSGSTAAELSALNAGMMGGVGAGEAAALGGAAAGGSAIADPLAGYMTSGAVEGSTMGGAMTGAGGSAGAVGSGTTAGWLGQAGNYLGGISGNSWLNAGANLLSGYLGNKASGDAVDAQLAAGREANALQRYMYDTTRNDFAPYRAAGVGALGQIQSLLKDPSSIKDDPGYQFGLNQGTNTLENSATSRGMTYSGQQAKALTQFGNDYAGTKMNETYNRLAGLAGIGQQATGSTANAGQNYANQVGNTTQDMGNVRASGYVGGANAWGNALSSIGNNYQMSEFMKMYGRGG